MLTYVSKLINCSCIFVIIFAVSLQMDLHVAAAAASQKNVGTTINPSVMTSKTAQKVVTSPNTAASAPVLPQIKEWGPYLDVAYELTYWEKSEIKEWREKRDQELGETLASYIATWSSRLTPRQNGNAYSYKELMSTYKERDFLRLAIAQTIEYLQNDNTESLGNALVAVELLKGKTCMPEIAFWTRMIKSFQALESNDSDLFVSQIYSLWNSSILYFEQSEVSRSASGKTQLSTIPFYYRNLINLVVNKAIITKKLENLNALGPLFLMMRERNLGEKDNEGKYTSTLIQRIADGLTAPDSDSHRLNYTIAMIESKRLQQIASAKLDSEGMTDASKKSFEDANIYNELAFKWAASRRSSGVVSAAVEHLDITSFAIQRLPDNEKASAYAFFANLPGQEGTSALLKAMAIFNDIATYSAGGWDKAGYQSRELFLKSAHRLWRSIMELSLWSGDYYLTKLNSAKDPKNIQNFAGPMQIALDSYLDFLGAQMGRGYSDAIPDSAYFGASESAEKLAYAYQKINAFSTDNNAYNLWLVHRLQATELYPFALREVRQTSALLKQDGRYNLYLDYFIPLASRIKKSPAIRKWIDEQHSDTATSVSNYIASVEKLFADNHDEVGSETTGPMSETALIASFQSLREELQRKPDHPLHKLLKSFYLEELQKTTSFTRLMKDPNKINRGL